MYNQKSSAVKSIFLLRLEILKNEVWSKPTFTCRYLKSIALLAMDAIIEKRSRVIDLPMELFSLYDLINCDFENLPAFRTRIKLYTYYTAKLYVYLKKHLDADTAYQIFSDARGRALQNEQPYAVRGSRRQLQGLSGQQKRIRKSIGI